MEVAVACIKTSWTVCQIAPLLGSVGVVWVAVPCRQQWKQVAVVDDKGVLKYVVIIITWLQSALATAARDCNGDKRPKLNDDILDYIDQPTTQ